VLRLTTIPRPESPALAGSGTVGARAHLRGQCVKSGLPWIVSRAAANAAGGSPQPTEPLACQVGVLQDVHHGPSHLAVASGPAAAEHSVRGIVTKGPTHSTMQSSEGKCAGARPSCQVAPGSTRTQTDHIIRAQRQSKKQTVTTRFKLKQQTNHEKDCNTEPTEAWRCLLMT
jgi:hypothetical protein